MGVMTKNGHRTYRAKLVFTGCEPHMVWQNTLECFHCNVCVLDDLPNDHESSVFPHEACVFLSLPHLFGLRSDEFCNIPFPIFSSAMMLPLRKHHLVASVFYMIHIRTFKNLFVCISMKC